MSRALALVLLLGWLGVAHAQSQQCRQWYVAGPGTDECPGEWKDSALEAAEDYARRWEQCANMVKNACGTDPYRNVHVSEFVPGTWPNFQFRIAGESWNGAPPTSEDCRSGDFGPTSRMSIPSRLNPAGCPVCPAAGTWKNLKDDDDAAEGESVCVEGCEYIFQPGYLKVEIGGEGGGWVGARGRATGLACGSSPGHSASGGTGEDGDCEETAEGLVCLQPPPSQCAEVNGDVVCPQRTPPDGCMGYRSGGVACDSDAPSPPAPDSGVPGEPAPPDVIVSVFNNVTNYYGPGTVGGSTQPPTTQPPRDGDPIGGGDGEGEGDSASGGETCDAAPACEGDPILCALLEQQWRSRCVESVTDEELEEVFGPTEGEDGELVGKVEFAVPESFPSGGWITTECPQDIQINLGGELPTVTIPVSEWCVWLRIIGTLVMVSAYIGAIRIVVGGL